MRLIMILLVLGIASLACNFPGSAAATRPPAQPTLRPEEMQQFEEGLKATMASSAGSGDVTITITEQQLNTFVAAELAKQQNDVFSDPQADLTSNGRMNIYGKVNQGGISADTTITVKPRIDADGKPKLDIESISLGSIPVPDALKNQLAGMVNNTLSDYLASNDPSFKVKNLEITDGQMTVTGTR